MIACTCSGCGRKFEAEPVGGHRLMCGDATNAEHVTSLAAGAEAALCFTSPPYAQQRDYTTGGVGDWDALMQGVFRNLPMAPAGQVLVNLGLVHRKNEWHAYWDGWVAWMRGSGWRPFGWYVWDQGPGMPGDWNGRLAPSFEFVFHFNRAVDRPRKTVKAKWGGQETHLRKDGSSTAMRTKEGKVGAWQHVGRPTQEFRIPDSVLRVGRHKARGIEVEHPAVFPVALATEIITAFSDAGDVLFEPFSGSGTTIISAEINGRLCLAMDIAPIYVDLAVRRWQQFTGRSAVREGDGRAFDDLVAS